VSAGSRNREQALKGCKLRAARQWRAIQIVAGNNPAEVAFGGRGAGRTASSAAQQLFEDLLVRDQAAEL
jgi:hypothetical protein